jgi:chloramphenicol-sensitive protein RarD
VLTAIRAGRRTGEPLGFAYGAGAYAIWGMFPAFFGMLAFAGPLEIVAHRVAWTLLLLVALLAVTRRLATLRGIDRRAWLLVVVGAVVISANWGIYVYAVLAGHVSQAALGYFVNPLVSVAIGVAVFKERMTIAGRCALGLAVAGVAVLTIGYHRIPYIALGLALSFAAYGVVKKLQPLPPTTSLTAETVVMTPLALGYLGWLGYAGTGTADTPAHWVLLALSGPMTAVPLLLFGAAAHRLPVVSIGVLQYLTPVLQFLWAVLIRHEVLTTASWLGFGLVWLALAIFTTDAVYRATRRPATTIEEEPIP